MSLKMKELLALTLVFMTCLQGSYAPFPEGHPYRFLNPLIEPWWNKINKDSQQQVLSAWKRVEPSAFALSRLLEAKADLLSGRVRDEPSKPYPTESYGDSSEASSEPESAAAESQPEAEAKAESEAEAEAESPVPESKPSSFAY